VAQQCDVAMLPSVGRRFSYYVELARAYSIRGEDVAAVHMLLRAENESADELRFNVDVRALVRAAAPGERVDPCGTSPTGAVATGRWRITSAGLQARLGRRHGRRRGRRAEHRPPGAAGKTILLDPAGDIPDPHGRAPAAYRECAQRLHEVIVARTREWQPAP
jgi:hypothetical protein